MASSTAIKLETLQDELRLLMLDWHYHRLGQKPLRGDLAKAFEDRLVEANFALAEARLDLMDFDHNAEAALAAASQQLDESAAMLKRAMELSREGILALDDAMPMAPLQPSNVLVFTGSWHPQPANDSHGSVA